MPQLSDDDLARQWHDQMRRYHRLACALDRALMAQHEITGSDFEVLQQLHESGRAGTGMRMNELGETVHLSQSALSRLISRLEHDGLVERSMCIDDRRSVWTKITDAGAKRYAEAKPTQRTILREYPPSEQLVRL
jgi:DNA-binding MarR family transcriptional regulator